VQITIVTFKGYNEQHQLVAAGILNRMRRQGRRAFVTTPSDQVTMNASSSARIAATSVLWGRSLRTHRNVKTFSFVSVEHAK
jgi:hypothetical protein